MEQERKVEPIGRELVRRLLPRRDPEGHKGTFGKGLCLCGSVGYTGAPVFASRGAVRSGAGLVFLGVPDVIIALKCETDFVAQNVDFVKLTQDILDLAVANKCKTLDEVKALPMGNGTVQDAVTDRSGITGETVC